MSGSGFGGQGGSTYYGVPGAGGAPGRNGVSAAASTHGASGAGGGGAGAGGGAGGLGAGYGGTGGAGGVNGLTLTGTTYVYTASRPLIGGAGGAGQYGGQGEGKPGSGGGGGGGGFGILVLGSHVTSLAVYANVTAGAGGAGGSAASSHAVEGGGPYGRGYAFAAGGFGGGGGDGVQIYAGSVMVAANTSVAGGAGGAAGVSRYSSLAGSPGSGISFRSQSTTDSVAVGRGASVVGGSLSNYSSGFGGAGVYGTNSLNRYKLGTLNLFNAGRISGGTGHYGGGGVVEGDNAVIVNPGAIVGGGGYDGGQGASVYGGSLINTGSLTGGNGSFVGGDGFDGGGQYSSRITINNSGSISGGAGGTIGGVGLYLSGAATVVNNGVISGGAGNASGGRPSDAINSSSETTLVLSASGADGLVTVGTITGQIEGLHLELSLDPGPAPSVTLSNVIAGGGSVTKIGANTLVLTGASTYTGGTAVTAGVLEIGSGGSLTSPITIDAGVLRGVGSTTEGVAGAGGTFAPGNAAGQGPLTVGGTLSIPSGSAFQETISGTTKNLYSVAKVAGQVTLGGALNLAVSPEAAALPVGTIITLIQETGTSPTSVSGTFAGLPQGATVSAGDYSFTVSYSGGASGHDVTLTETAAGTSRTAPGAGAISTVAARESYTGKTLVNGELDLAVGGAVASSSQVSLKAPGAVFDVSGADAGGTAAIQELSGVAGSTIRLGGGVLSLTETTAAGYAGAITDGGVAGGTGGGLVVNGSAPLTLSGSDTYTGKTQIYGQLDLAGGAVLNTSKAVTLKASGAVFDISGATGKEAILNLAGVAGSAIALGANALKINDTTAATFAGVISDGGAAGGQGGSLIVKGTVPLNLTGANTFTGGVTLLSGTLELGTITAAGVNHALTFSGAATLQLDAGALTGPATAQTYGTGILGFMAGDHIDLASLAYAADASATLSGTRLTVTSGGDQVTLVVKAIPAGDTFTASNDGQGHVLVGLVGS